jgi:transglutaminase-like putative cysteine protease
MSDAHRRPTPQEAGLPQAQSLAGLPQLPVPADSTAQSRILRVEHETVYRYDAPVQNGVHSLRLYPTQDHRQSLVDLELDIQPACVRGTYEDVFGNQVVQASVTGPFTEFRAHLKAGVKIFWKPLAEIPHTRPMMPLVWMPWQRQMMHAYLLPPELPEVQLQTLSNYAMSFVNRQANDLLETLLDINRTIFHEFQYVPGITTLESTPFEVLQSRQGVCQDFANLFICLARLLGIPARYRVGYIFTGTGYANQLQSEASHAWAEVYLPAVGWRGFDPTNGCEAGLDHIRVATGRNYRDATPTSGTIISSGANETLTVRVSVYIDSEQPAS